MARGKASVQIPTEPPQTEARSAHVGWPVPTLPVLYLGYHTPESDPANPDVAALGALEQAVFGETSPLYRELVLKEQKVVTLRAEASAHRDPGLFSVIARVRKPRRTCRQCGCASPGACRGGPDSHRCRAVGG